MWWRGSLIRGARPELALLALTAYIQHIMSISARWNLIVSRRTDHALRRLLASRGPARKGDLSRFVEEAVQARILEIQVGQAKSRNAHVPAETIERAVEEALEWARRA